MIYQVFDEKGRRVGFVPAVNVEQAQKDLLKTFGYKVVSYGNDFEEGDRAQPEGDRGGVRKTFRTFLSRR